MKKRTVLILFFIFAAAQAQKSNIKWIDFPDPKFHVNGLSFWEENKPDLFRLPKSLQDVVRTPVWRLSQSPSGGRIRFRSDCTALLIRFHYPHLGDMKNMHTFGQCGVDLYIDNVYFRTAIPKDTTYIEFEFFKDIQPQMRNFTLYLPLYIGVKVVAIGVNPDAEFEPPLPFDIEKPVVYYGSSITQGGCASRPGMSYQAILHRNINADFVNLGYSGNGMGEPEMAAAVASVDASCYVLDFGVNLPSADSLAKVYAPFIDILRDKRPHTPIIAVTPIYIATELLAPNKATFMRDVIHKAVAQRRNNGDQNIMLVNGLELLGPEFADGSVDGVHPNDLGFLAMAEGLQPYLTNILKVAGRHYKLLSN